MTQIKLNSLTKIDKVSIVGKGIRGEIYHTIHRYENVDNKYMKYYDKNIELSYFRYQDVNNLYDRAMS